MIRWNKSIREFGIVILREFHHCFVHDGRKNEPCLSREICDVDNMCSSYQRNDDNDNRKERRKIWWGNSAAAARLRREKIDSRQVYFDNTNIFCVLLLQIFPHAPFDINIPSTIQQDLRFCCTFESSLYFPTFLSFPFSYSRRLFSCARSTQRKLHHHVRKCGEKHCLWDYGTYTKCCELYVCSLFCFSHNKCCHFCVFNLLFAQFRVQLDIIVLRFFPLSVAVCVDIEGTGRIAYKRFGKSFQSKCVRERENRLTVDTRQVETTANFGRDFEISTASSSRSLLPVWIFHIHSFFLQKLFYMTPATVESWMCLRREICVNPLTAWFCKSSVSEWRRTPK